MSIRYTWEVAGGPLSLADLMACPDGQCVTDENGERWEHQDKWWRLTVSGMCLTGPELWAHRKTLRLTFRKIP